MDSTQDAPVVATRGITKAFGGVAALRGVSIEFRAGEVHALVGENGAGKSTLVKLISGCEAPDAGTIEVGGEAHGRLTPREALDLGIRVIYQEPALVDDLTVGENICLSDLPRKGPLVDRREVARRAGKILSELGIDLDPATSLSDLSLAQRQFVEVAKAVSAETRLVVFDEPTASLTAEDAERLFSLIERLRASGVAIAYISHRLSEIYRLADCITVMRDGATVGTCAASELPRDELIRRMVGRSLSEVYPTRTARPGKVALRAEHISTAAIHDVSLFVREGEILGLAGLAGAGRTEVLRALFGADQLQAGRIYVGEREVRLSSPQDAIAEGIGLLPEDRKNQGLLVDLSIRDNIALSLLKRISHLLVLNRGREAGIVDEQYRKLGVKAVSTSQAVRTLSGGNQQKVVVGKWLASTARILMFDEPTQGIDVGAKHEIYRLMGELTDRGYAIIMVSSEMEELLGMSDRIVVLAEGRVAGSLDSRSEFSQERVMEYASLSMEEMVAHE